MLVCKICGTSFEVAPATLEKFPGWVPSKCAKCHTASRSTQGRSAKPPAGRFQGATSAPLTRAQVLERYSAGPLSGLFTDGSASPNPGPGGWGVVYVIDNEIIDEARGQEPHTTNNRMELLALISAYKMASPTVALDVWTDSQLCVSTVNEWAASWERQGWRRKGGEIKNLELVKELYALAKTRQNLTLRWVKAHNGSRWNEYADALASAYMRREV